MRLLIGIMLAIVLVGCDAVSDDTKNQLEIAFGKAAGEVLDVAKEKSAEYVADAATKVRDQADTVAAKAAEKVKASASKAIDTAMEVAKDGTKELAKNVNEQAVAKADSLKNVRK